MATLVSWYQNVRPFWILLQQGNDGGGGGHKMDYETRETRQEKVESHGRRLAVVDYINKR